MSDLPSRDQVESALLMKGGTDRFMHGQALLQPYADGVLQTRQELIDSLDYNDLADRLIRHCIGLDAASTCTLRQVKEWLAATGEDTDG